jgi:hypothetical protein
MTPALEYLTRTGLIKEWLTPPCSLYLYERITFKKLAVTINEEFTRSDFYSVKHWILSECRREQALPPMRECRVPKKEVFDHPAVVVPDHHLIPYFESVIPDRLNSYRASMDRLIYQDFYDKFAASTKHLQYQVNWLWGVFVRIYAPELMILQGTYELKTDFEIYEEQRDLVFRYQKGIWKYWHMWLDYMLHSPGELIFRKQYAK